jgi:hypothetical protein
MIEPEASFHETKASKNCTMQKIARDYGTSAFRNCGINLRESIMEEIEGEELVYTDVDIALGSCAALFFISHRSVGKGGNTSTVVCHCIL